VYLFKLHTATSRIGLLQAEKDRYMKKLEQESERTSQLRRQISSDERKDQEICDLHQQLSDLQVLCCETVDFNVSISNN